jgi:hypothetical protein
VMRRWSSCGAQRGQVRAGAWPAPTVSAARPAARAHTQQHKQMRLPALTPRAMHTHARMHTRARARARAFSPGREGCLRVQLVWGWEPCDEVGEVGEGAVGAL